ncbi:MAG: response regulator, partial [Phenylobacterium sp.]
VRPDIILCDIDMPRMDGFETLAHLRADPTFARTPIIMATGREDVSAIDRAFRDGATSFAVKPINWRLLSYQIRYVHRAHQAELSLLEARRRARAEAFEVSEAMSQLCVLGARFVADALKCEPALRAPAAEYLQALQQARTSARKAASG